MFRRGSPPVLQLTPLVFRCFNRICNTICLISTSCSCFDVQSLWNCTYSRTPRAHNTSRPFFWRDFWFPSPPRETLSLAIFLTDLHLKFAYCFWRMHKIDSIQNRACGILASTLIAPIVAMIFYIHYQLAKGLDGLSWFVSLVLSLSPLFLIGDDTNGPNKWQWPLIRT